MVESIKEKIDFLTGSVKQLSSGARIYPHGNKRVSVSKTMRISTVKGEAAALSSFTAKVTGESWRHGTLDTLYDDIRDFHLPSLLSTPRVSINGREPVPMFSPELVEEEVNAVCSGIKDSLPKIINFRKSEDFKKHPNFSKIAHLYEDSPNFFFDVMNLAVVDFETDLKVEEGDNTICLADEPEEGIRFSYMVVAHVVFIDHKGIKENKIRENDYFHFSDLFPEILN